eukprot:4505891-Ditylum_brightwellii.AAC.1
MVLNTVDNFAGLGLFEDIVTSRDSGMVERDLAKAWEIKKATKFIGNILWDTMLLCTSMNVALGRKHGYLTEFLLSCSLRDVPTRVRVGPKEGSALVRHSRQAETRLAMYLNLSAEGVVRRATAVEDMMTVATAAVEDMMAGIRILNQLNTQTNTIQL